MYIWGRLGRMVLGAKSRGPATFGDETRHQFRCWPTDVDNYFHMNNARYVALADIGRIELFLRTGMWRLGRERNWWPLMGGVQTAYIHEIKLWSRFEVVSSFATWEDRQLLGLHRFVLPDGKTATMIRTTIGVYDYSARAFQSIDDVAALLGTAERPRPPTQAEQSFLASNAALRKEGRG